MRDLMNEKVICYLGPSLSLYHAVETAPNVIYRPPARQSDIMSDTVEIQPDRIILVDGEFLSNLSVWHKEIIFALSKGIAVYGAASMGALRAADLWRQGMVGSGKIFGWYKDGLTEDDSEVALLYGVDTKGNYHANTVPLVNVRATLEHHAGALEMVKDYTERLLEEARSINFRERTPAKLINHWEEIVGLDTAEFLANNIIDQKRVDALELLQSYLDLTPDPQAKLPTDTSLSKFFWAAYDRDRKITVAGRDRIRQSAIDGYIALHSTDHHQIFWDARNFYLTNMLAEKLGVTINVDDVQHERDRFLSRHGLEPGPNFEAWANDNALTEGELQILLVKMARVRRLHQWLASSLVPLESTKITLDYLKSHNAYEYWAYEAARSEKAMELQAVDDMFSVDTKIPIEVQLAEYAHRSGITIDGSMEEFISETGFSSRHELNVALERLNALKKD